MSGDGSKPAEMGAKPSEVLLATWALKETWPTRMFAALAFGLDPHDVADASGVERIKREMPEAANTFIRQTEVIVERDNYFRENEEPNKLLAWAKGNGLIDFHDDWYDAVPNYRRERERFMRIASDHRNRIQARERLIKEQATAPFWTVRQGVFYSLDLMEMEKDPDDWNTSKETEREFKRRLDHVRKAVRLGWLPLEPSPREFIQCAERLNFPFHSAWHEALPPTEPAEPKKNDTADAADRTEPREYSTKERNTLQMLVAAMAQKGYGYDPSAARSRKPREIAGDVATLGGSVTAETVAKHIKAGLEFLSIDDSDCEDK